MTTAKDLEERGYREIELSMSNFDHSVDQGLSEALRGGKVYAKHAAWNFCGYVWFDGGVFRETVYRYHDAVAEFQAESLDDLMAAANDAYGWD